MAHLKRISWCTKNSSYSYIWLLKPLFTPKAYGWLGSGVLADWLMPKANSAYIGQKRKKKKLKKILETFDFNYTWKRNRSRSGILIYTCFLTEILLELEYNPQPYNQYIHVHIYIHTHINPITLSPPHENC